MRIGLNERVEFTSYAIRARLAAYGAGSIREYGMKDGGLVVESTIPGTRMTASVIDRPGRNLRGVLLERKDGKRGETMRDRCDLTSDFQLALFMHRWDEALMRDGLRGFYPACLLEFVDRLIFDERDASIAALHPGVTARRAMAFPWRPEWRPSDELAFLAEQYADDPSAGAATRRSAAALKRFLETEEDVPFDVELSRSRWIGQVMRMMLSAGREVSSPLGTWKEAIGRETVRSAIWLMCRNLPEATLARKTLGDHVSTFTRAHANGGSDNYILMNGEEPVAVATVSCDGKVSSVTKPGFFPNAAGNPLVSAEERLVSAVR